MKSVLLTGSCLSDAEEDREVFWAESIRIAVQGESRPSSLTEDEIRRICRLALVAVPRRAFSADSAVTPHTRVPR